MWSDKKRKLYREKRVYDGATYDLAAKTKRELIEKIANWKRDRDEDKRKMPMDDLLFDKFSRAKYKPSQYVFTNMESTEPGFALSPKQWIEKTGAIGVTSRSGRYGGGTFAHRHIAFEFATWLSPEFKYFLISEFERLKEEEQGRLSADWNLQRTLSKINYRIHTDAIKEHIVPPVVTKKQANFIYASEADLLNVALFGKAAGEWRSENPNAERNMRDDATLEQLVVLSNPESLNADIETVGKLLSVEPVFI
jgi:hypothetical protein